ncbi:uncharacterized protein LOC143452779 isoform X2 [Clavelina lepadiformis]|uniref:IRF tryptophan pentad repeat domain-containing protein n=1 Tax=Clavelina lepadiformis TaxID=159417 RepID=A0ABP0GWF1_CLALP
MSSSSTSKPPISENLQFKPWLVKQISSGKYKDLEWIDADKKRVFKLPWTKKNYPNWEEHHEIFRAWAQHRSIVRHDPEVLNQHISLMKSNFRTILRKCSEIEELKNFHQLGLQTGNYKVYKVLTPEEVQLKKLQVLEDVEKEPEESDIVEISASVDIKDIQWLPETTIPKSWITASTTLGIALLEADKTALKRPLTSDEQETTSPGKPKVKKTQATQTAAKDPKFKAKEVIFLSDPVVSDVTPQQMDDLNNLNEPPLVIEVQDIIANTEEVAEIKTEQIETMELIKPEDTEGFHMLLEAAEIADSPFNIEPVEEVATTSNETDLRVVELSFLDVLEKLNMPRELLFAYEVHVCYDQKEVFNDVYYNMNDGYRFHYDTSEGKEPPTLTNQEFSESIKFPAGSGGKSFQSVLRNMDLGLLLKTDETYNLISKRLCQSRIFALTSYGEVDEADPIAIAREEEVTLFNYNKFLQEWYQSLKNKQPPPNIEILLSFGKKPKDRASKVFISMRITPKAAAAMVDLAQSLTCKKTPRKSGRGKGSPSKPTLEDVLQIWM